MQRRAFIEVKDSTLDMLQEILKTVQLTAAQDENLEKFRTFVTDVHYELEYSEEPDEQEN